METKHNCARCENTEIIAAATEIVSGEPWCLTCTEAYSCVCETCFANFDGDDCEHGERGEYCCYNCAQIDATK